MLAILSTLTACSGDPENAAGGTSSGSGGGSTSSSGSGGSGGAGGGSECQPGETQFCYSGPPGTEIVGACKAGLATCNPEGTGFGPCEGEITPSAESCATMGDDDCDGQINEDGCACIPGEAVDCYSGSMSTNNVGICHSGTHICNADGLGYGPCTGEVTPAVETCATPEDDDCDGQINEEGAACVCVPNSMATCYSGPAGSENVGACKGGMKSCNALGTGYGPCFGEIVPVAETCLTPEDDDCDNEVNEGGAGCVCQPNTASTCYSGSPGTAGVGICKLGTAICNDQGTAYGPCAGEVTPGTETCNTPDDDDCDGQTNEEGAGCVCLPNSSTTCYSGDPGTAGVGICKLGTTQCNAQGTAYGPCDGEVTPAPEDCSTPADENCNGMTDACGLFGWSLSFGDATEQDGHDIAADSAGNVYITGGFQGTIDLGGGPLTSAGGMDLFIAKFSSSGSHIWSKRFGNAFEQVGRGIAVDAGGNVYVTGYFGGSVDFGGGPLTSAGGRDIFVLKLNSAGTHVMSKRFGGALAEEGASIAVDGVSNIALAGIVESTVDFGGGPLTSAGN
ncbi:MAG: SBBP repeat-containing protein, partial [Polyangiaceae bacterium]|nr:SBBP repeat-containing protein [Polyangiaceae bacterium]